MQDISLACVLGAIILCLYVRPFGARDWHVAGIGALVAWVIGPLGVRSGFEAVGDSANIVAFFLGLMLIAGGAEAGGLYARAAEALRQRRTVQARVGAVLVIGAVVTAILSNDATPLVLTPAIFAAGVAHDRATREAALAATFTADGTSLLLPVSNPVNLLFFERFDIGFGRYLTTITPAAAAGMLAMALVTFIRSRNLRATLEPVDLPHPSSRNIRIPLLAVALLAVAYVAGGMANVPLGVVTLAGGVLMLAAARGGGPVDPSRIHTHIAPGVLLFVVALLVLVESVSAAGLLDRLASPLEWLAERPGFVTVLGSAIIAAVLSNLMNNWPAALLLAATIAATPGAHQELVAGALIGSAIGANFTMLGSLSTVFWLSLARQSGATFGPWEYARAAFAPTLAGVLAASVVAAALV